MATTAHDVRSALEDSALLLVVDFPQEELRFMEFCSALGTVMPKLSATGGSTINELIGDVRYRPDIPESLRLPTQSCGPLTFHTARACSAVRPSIFVMWKVCQGWDPVQEGLSGRSLFLTWDTVVPAFIDAATAHNEDLTLLTQTKVSYRPKYMREPPAHEPLLNDAGDGRWFARYWEGIAGRNHPTIETSNANRYMKALKHFDDFIHSSECPITECALQTGDVAIMDNRRVAHGRRAFLGSRSDVRGRTDVNPRRILSAHIASLICGRGTQVAPVHSQPKCGTRSDQPVDANEEQRDGTTF